MNRTVLVSGAWVACIATIFLLVRAATQWIFDPTFPPLVAISVYLLEIGTSIALLAVSLRRHRTGGIVLAGTALYVSVFTLTQSPSVWYYGSFLAQPLIVFPSLARYCFVAICLAAAYHLSPPNPEARTLREERRTARIVRQQATQLQYQQQAQRLVEHQRQQHHPLAEPSVAAAPGRQGAREDLPPAPAPSPYGMLPAPSNGLAVAAIISVWFASVVGLVLGIVALRQIRVTGQAGRGMALTAVIAGSIITSIATVLFVVYLGVIINVFRAY